MDTTDNEQTNEPLDWRAIARALQAPFDPTEVDFRVQGKAGGSGKAQVVAYVDARCVQDRLDAVVGPGAWSFDWNPINFDAKGEIQSAKGMLTIYGVTKSDIGSASNFEASLGAVSHCFKRAAVLWGVGRYLYSVPSMWVEVEQNGRLSAQVIAQLRAKLPRLNGSGGARPTASAAAENTAAAHDEPDETSAPATAAPPRPATPRPTQRAKAPNPWLATDGYDPISDNELRRRVKALGINNMLDFETFLTDVRTRYKVYSEATILNELLVREKSQAAARAKVTPQTPQTPQAAQPAADSAPASAPIPHDLHGAFTPARGA